MMNIQATLKQCRVARKNGQISNEQQVRILRRLGKHPAMLAKIQAELKQRYTAPPSAAWTALMELRNQIERDIMPTLLAKRQAERDCFDIQFAV